MKKNYSIKYIREQHPDIKKSFDKSYLWLNFVIRPLSFPITKLFIDLKITPNQTTVASILSGLLGSFLIATGDYSLAVVGAIFVNLFTLLDAIDGNIARTLKIQSLQGQFLDGMAAYIVFVFLYPCIGMGLFFNNSNSLSILSQVFMNQGTKAYLIFLGGLAGALNIFYLYMSMVYNDLMVTKNSYHTLSDDNKQEKYTKSTNEMGDLIRIVRFIRSHVILNFTRSNGFVFPILFASVIFRFLDLFLVLYSTFHIFYFFLYYYRNSISLKY